MFARSRLMEARIIDLSASQALDLSVKEINRAKLFWVFLLQNEHYLAEIKACNGCFAPLPDAQEFTRVQREELGVSGGSIIKQ